VSEQTVKKVIIKKEDLPAFNGVSQNYLVRYRVVSEDKNRSSHWSPYYSISSPESEQISCSVEVVANAVNMVWQQPETPIGQYDIYFKLDSQEWKYIASSISTQFSTLIPESTLTIQVAVQVPTYPKQYFPLAAIFTSAQIVL
jgi:hypothetical protein